MVGPLRLSVVALAAVLVAVVAYARLAPLEPPEARLALPGTVVLDAAGRVLERDARAGFRIPVTLDRVAPRLLQATIAAEDRRFLAHVGVDPVAIGRALVTQGERPSGASTITQQLARRLYLAADERPALLRKADEARIALQLEANRSKAELLALYLNDAYYGRGAYGVEAAARVYFGTSARHLDLAHAAYLAGLPQRPSDLDDAAALARQRYVLARMVEDGWIARADADAALARPIRPLPAVAAPIADHFVAAARRELASLRPDLAGRDGLVIETTLDAGLQLEIERVARLRLASLADRNATNAAVVALEPRTGRILAYIGSATNGDARHGGAIDMARTARQPGSALKPFLYAAALERGFTAASPLLDVPTTFETASSTYAPLNYDRAFHGVVPLRVALASSLNVPAVRTLDAIGIDAMLEILQRAGLRTLDEPDRYGLALTLGGGEVTLVDLASAYAAIGTLGEHAAPYAVERVRDATGRVVYERRPAPARRVLSAQHAYLIADILSDPDARIAGFGGFTPFDLPFPVAVKSGTTTGYRDAWTLGATPTLALGVWVGNADGSPMRDVSGLDGAAPIWHDAMLAAALARPMSPFVQPPGLVTATVCAPTGLRPGPACPSPVRELFVAGTEPAATETYYIRGADGVLRVDPPLEARAWARDAGLALAETSDATRELLRIVAPAPGAVYYRAPELTRQEVVLRASASAAVKRVLFAIDGVTIGESDASDPRITWTLVPGLHTLRVSGLLADGTATHVTTVFEVR